MNGLVDTHCHLTLGALAKDKEDAWERARKANVGKAVVVGINPETSAQAIDWVQDKPGLYATAGIHPNDCAKATEDSFAAIEGLATRNKVVAIGETGLDQHWKDTPLPTQIEFLERHMALALERDLPLIIHLREAFDPAIGTLRPFGEQGGRAVLHCFSGGPKDLEPYLGWDFYVSFSGVVTYKKAADVQEAAKMTPADRLLVETDAPWLSPVPHRGKRNEPAYVVHTAKKVAELRGISLEEVTSLTTSNAETLFRFSD